MTTRKTDAGLKSRQRRNFVRLGLPFLAALGIGFYAFVHENYALFVFLFAVAAALGLSGLVRETRLFRRYQCPQCGGRLAESPRIVGKPIEFFCEGCDVLWDSGFIESDVTGG